MKSAEDNIVQFLKNNPSVFAAAQLQRMEFRNRNGTLASPKAISRRLQELAEGEHALLEVSYEKNHAHYKIKDAHRKMHQIATQLPNGSVRLEYVPA